MIITHQFLGIVPTMKKKKELSKLVLTKTFTPKVWLAETLLNAIEIDQRANKLPMLIKTTKQLGGKKKILEIHAH